jgi:hypothetical protein
MVDFADYAIIDTNAGSMSEGKILVLVDDERTAREIASDLQGRGFPVAIKTVPARRGSVVVPEDDRWSAPLPLPGAAL